MSLANTIRFILICVAVAVLCAILAPRAHAQTVIVSAQHFGGNGTEVSGTIYFRPALASGQPASYRPGNGGIATVLPVQVTVVNGAFSVTMPDTDLTAPQNICFVASANSRGQQLLGPGYNCVQPHATSRGDGDWCAGGACNFDNLPPSIPALPIVNINGTGYLALSGGSLSGPLLLAADPSNGLGAATKQYVDNHASGSGTVDSCAGGQIPYYIATGAEVGCGGATLDGAGNASFTSIRTSGPGPARFVIPATDYASLVAALPCASGLEGAHAGLTDSSVNTWGVTAAGSGSFHVPVYCNGTDWVVD